MRTNQAIAEVFFTAFKALKENDRAAFLERVIRDAKLREDLIDVALIEEAKKMRGKQVSAREYFAKRHRTGQAA